MTGGSYEDQLSEFVRRYQVRVSVLYYSGPKLVMLPPRATLNDLYRNIDSPKHHALVYTEPGAPIPRTDEYLMHFITRMRMQPWHLRPKVYRVFALTQALLPLRILSRSETEQPPQAPPTSFFVSSPVTPPEDTGGTAPAAAPACQTETDQPTGAPGSAEDGPASAEPPGP